MGFNSKYTGAQVEELLGKIPTANNIWHSGNFIPSDYLPLSGGTINSLDHQVPLTLANTANTTRIGFKRNNELLGYLGFVEVDKPLFFSVAGERIDILHSRNIYSYNAGSATKLQTARTIWGQSFDGTGNVSGNLNLDHNAIVDRNSNRLILSDGSNLYLGTADVAAYNTYVTGVTVRLRYGNSSTTGLILNYDGNVGIGTTTPAYKLDVNGNIHTSGTLTQNSDIRLKNINKDILLSIEDIANAPLFEFTYKSDENKRIHVGTSAQYWIEKNNWFCKKQDNGYYDMEIQNLALASAISIAKEFKKYKEETESTISSMKKEIEELKQIILNMNK